MCGLSSEGGNVVGIAAKPVQSKVALGFVETPYGCRSPYSCIRATQEQPKSYPSATRALPERYPSATQGIPKGYPSATQGIPKGYPRDTQALPKGYPRDTQGIPKGYPREQQARNTGATPEQCRSNTLPPRSIQGHSTRGIRAVGLTAARLSSSEEFGCPGVQ